MTTRVGQPPSPDGIRCAGDPPAEEVKESAAAQSMLRKAQHRVARRGRCFTLLELLVACAMFGLLFAGLTAVFRNAMHLRDRAEGRFDADIERQRVRAVLKEDIRGIAPPVGVFAGPTIGEKEEDSGVRRDSLEFVAAVGRTDQETPLGDLIKIEYSLLEPEEDGEGYDLVRAVTPAANFAESPDPEETVLLTRVDVLELTYYDGSEWQDAWDSTTAENKLPEAVRIWIERMATDQEEEPETLEIVLPILAQSRASADQGSQGGGP